MSIVLALLALSFLVFFHELGHFLAAKFFKVGVLEFSIGMGPRILSGVFHNTRYSLKLLPLGGSCAMLGEDAAGSGDFSTAKGEEEEDVLDFDGVVFSKEDLEKYSFEKKPAWQRFIICFGGVWHNFLLAFLFAIILTVNIGTEFPIIGASSTVETPAMESGLQDGDRIVAIAFADGSKRSLATLQELSIFLELHQEDFQKGDIKLTVLRDGKKESFSFSPYRDPESGRYRLGVQLKNGRVSAKNLCQVLEYSYYEFRFNARIVFDSLAMNLGIMNLLPIPALDGGRLLFILFEMLLRKRLNPKWEERINTVGMAILLLLMVAIVFNDVFNLFTGVYSKLLN